MGSARYIHAHTQRPAAGYPSSMASMSQLHEQRGGGAAPRRRWSVVGALALLVAVPLAAFAGHPALIRGIIGRGLTTFALMGLALVTLALAARAVLALARPIEVAAAPQPGHLPALPEAELSSAPGFVVVADVTGVAVALQLLDTLAARQDERPVILVYENVRQENDVTRDRLDVLRRRLRLILVHVAEAPDDRAGGVGRVTAKLLERYRPPDCLLLDYTIAGSYRTTDTVRKALVRQGVPLANVSVVITDG